MHHAIATILLVGLLSTSTAWAAQIQTTINPADDSFTFKMTYQKAFNIEYPEKSGIIYETVQEKVWSLEGTADSSDPGVRDLIEQLNQKIRSDGSHAIISDLEASYSFHLTARDKRTSLDTQVVLRGVMTNYITSQEGDKTLVDVAWRGLSVSGPVIIDGIDVNIPLNLIETQEPQLYRHIAGTQAEEVLDRDLMYADIIGKQKLSNWHNLFDPTGITVDAAQFGIAEEIQGSLVTTWTLGESNLKVGRQVETIDEVEFTVDQTYTIKSTQATDQGNLAVIGYGVASTLDGVEVIGITPRPPEGYNVNTNEDFPVTIIYGMAGVAAVAGIAFFFISSRSLKNEAQGQQGIDPSRLVGYQTSSSAGGYQTNRGEAQLRDEHDYKQTRSYYEDQSAPPPQLSTEQEAACGCAASADMGSECDCEMQSSCLCDATCKCKAGICKEHSKSMQ